MDKDFHFQLIRSKKRRKTISLHIKEGRKIVLYAPYHTPKAEIEKFIKDKQSWIDKKISQRKELNKTTHHSFIPGERFLYLGDWYPLEIAETSNKGLPLQLSFGQFLIEKVHTAKAKDLFIRWYKNEAKEKIGSRIRFLSNRLQLFPKGIRITSAKYRWGSCSRGDLLSFSWRVIMAPLSVIDYILIHELVHIKEKNHSKKFWSSLEVVLPDYRKHRLWLKENGHRLCF